MGYSISGPSPGHQVGQERGWGPPGGAGRQHLKWGGQQRGERRGDWSAGLPPQRQREGGGPWGGQEGGGSPRPRPRPQWCPSPLARGAGVLRPGRRAGVQTVPVWDRPDMKGLWQGDRPHSWHSGGGEAEQHPATGRRLPFLGQVGLGQRCSVFLWWRAQMGQSGWSYLQTGAVWPYL